MKINGLCEVERRLHYQQSGQFAPDQRGASTDWHMNERSIGTVGAQLLAPLSRWNRQLM